MKSKEVFNDISDISIFYKYLYLGNTITFFNGLTDLTLSMDEKLNIYSKNETFPSVPPMLYNDMLFVPSVLGIISELKLMPAKEIKSLDNYWEEIKDTVAMNSVLN